MTTVFADTQTKAKEDAHKHWIWLRLIEKLVLKNVVCNNVKQLHCVPEQRYKGTVGLERWKAGEKKVGQELVMET